MCSILNPTGDLGLAVSASLLSFSTSRRCWKLQPLDRYYPCWPVTVSTAGKWWPLSVKKTFWTPSSALLRHLTAQLCMHLSVLSQRLYSSISSSPPCTVSFCSSALCVATCATSLAGFPPAKWHITEEPSAQWIPTTASLFNRLMSEKKIDLMSLDGGLSWPWPLWTRSTVLHLLSCSILISLVAKAR